jgi:ATP-dependent Clp protease adaptor protein ClpS
MRMTAEPTTAPQTDEQSQTRRFPPYHVILLNDDHHSIEFVVGVLRKVFGFAPERAVELTLEAHESGRAVVWTGAREYAEVMGEKLSTYHEHRGDRDLGPLGYSVEPAA